MTSILSTLAQEQSREVEKDLLEVIKNTKKAGAFDYSVEFDNRLYRRASLFGDLFNENLFSEDSLAAGADSITTEDTIDSNELSEIINDIQVEDNAAGSAYGEIFIPAEAMAPTTTSGCSSITKVEAGTFDVDY